MAWTLASLQDAASGFLDGFTNDFFGTMFPVCVRQAEERILQVAKPQPMRRRETVSAGASSAVIGQFPELLGVISLSVNSTPLLNKARDWIDEVYGANATTGQPAYYAVQQQLGAQGVTEITVAPPALAAQDYVVEYYAKPPSLVDSPNGTWISTNCENALLYGVLFHAYNYEKGEAEITANYKEEFEKALSLLKGITRVNMRRDEFRSSPQAMPEG